jgi:hypothetical protein
MHKSNRWRALEKTSSSFGTSKEGDIMRTNVVNIAGTILMAGCGSAIAARVWFTGIQTALVAGFAVGIGIPGQIPEFALRSRIAELEAQVAAWSKTGT